MGENPLLLAVRHDVADVAARLVYADWCAENGHRWAELLSRAGANELRLMERDGVAWRIPQRVRLYEREAATWDGSYGPRLSFELPGRGHFNADALREPAGVWRGCMVGSREDAFDPWDWPDPIMARLATAVIEGVRDWRGRTRPPIADFVRAFAAEAGVSPVPKPPA